MANVKCAGVREMIIDRCLRKQQGVTVIEIMERVNRTLEIDGISPITSLNTIRNDIAEISSRWKQPIRRRRIGKTVRYSYRDPTFSIFNGQLTDGELHYVYCIFSELKGKKKYGSNELFNEILGRLEEIIFV